MRIQKLGQRVLLGIISLIMSSCSNDNQDLIGYIHKINARKGRPVAPIPKFSFLPVFKFSEHDVRRNPFMPVKLQKNSVVGVPDQRRFKQGLEAYPLKNLKFVGILEHKNKVWALIQKPDQHIVKVRVGDYMGQHYGRVVAIKDHVIKLVETVNNTGMWEQKITLIHLGTGN